MDANAERAIGRLEGKVDSLLSSVEKYQEKGDQGRARIYQELEQIRSDAAESRAKVQELNDRMNEAGPVIADIKRWKERFIGMQMLAFAAAAALGVSASSIAAWLKAKFGFN